MAIDPATREHPTPAEEDTIVLPRSQPNPTIAYKIDGYGRKQGNGGTQALEDSVSERTTLEPLGKILDGSFYFPRE